MAENKFAVTLASAVGPDEEILEIEPWLAKKCWMVVEEQGKTDPPVLLDKDDLSVSPGAEQRLTQSLFRRHNLVLQPLEPRNFADQFEDIGRIRSFASTILVFIMRSWSCLGASP